MKDSTRQALCLIARLQRRALRTQQDLQTLARLLPPYHFVPDAAKRMVEKYRSEMGELGKRLKKLPVSSQNKDVRAR